MFEMNCNQFILTVCMLFINACTQVDVNGLDPDLFNNGGNGTGGGGVDALCEDVDSTFSTKVLPVFASKCSGTSCHTNGAENGGLNLDDDDDARGDGASGVVGQIKSEGQLNLTVTGQSPLLLKPLATSEGGQSGVHTGGQIFANKVDPAYKTLFCWIDAGAKNDLSDSKCTFGEHVYPIFRDRGCLGGSCHRNPSPAGNLNLSQGSVELLTGNGPATFANATITPVVTAGDVNSLLLTKPSQMNGITHGGGRVFNGQGDPDYQTIKCWIDEGARNN